MTDHTVLDIAAELRAAADREDWATAVARLETLQTILRSSPVTPDNRQAMQAALAMLDEATAHTARRRNEIRTLVEALSGEKLSGHDSA